METLFISFAEEASGNALLESEVSDSPTHAFKNSRPDDDDEDTEDEEEEGDEEENDSRSNDEDPPLDKDVVHSPVTTQPGGRPSKS